MSLIKNTLDGQINMVDVAIKRLKAFEPSEGYRLCFSGGKDSVCIKALADMAGVKYHAVYNITSVDPPELVRFIKSIPDVEMEQPRYRDGRAKTMWNLIPHKGMPPTRIMRYCCAELKEASGKGELNITGVRWAESVNRRKKQDVVNVFNGATVHNHDNDEARRMVESCYRTSKTLINPIIDWYDDDVWEFIKTERIPYCGLYDEGRKRLGCIGCPMGGTNGMTRDLQNYPKYRRAYIRAFDKMLKVRDERGLDTRIGWKSGEGVLNWWVGGQPYKLPLFDEYEEDKPWE